MAFSATGRSDVAGIIPEDYSNEFLASTVAASAVLSTFRTIRLGTKVTKMPVLSALPTAGFVTEYPTAGHEKPTTSAQWTNETITVEEIATIVPIPESVIEDSTVDLFDYMRPLIGEAFGKVIDGAVLLGTHHQALELVERPARPGQDREPACQLGRQRRGSRRRPQQHFRRGRGRWVRRVPRVHGSRHAQPPAWPA